MATQADHFLLLDEDTRPTAPQWWQVYTDGPEPHYQYSWLKFAKDGRPVPNMTEIYRDPDLIGHSWSMGCLLYVTREVVERVGGMDPRFGRGFEEHAEWSQRIHNAGFTTFVHQDHPGMVGKVWAADEHYAVTRSFSSDPDRDKRLARNKALREKLIDSTDFVDYRPPAGTKVVLTSYFTGNMDLQRNMRLPSSTDILQPLIDSVGKPLVILHDNLESPPPNSVRVHAPLPAYTQRWISQYQWLQNHPEVAWVWCVDATDVVALKDPFPGMIPGTLYVGDEPGRLDNQWIRLHCPKADVQWLRANATKLLLNCGIVGGDRATVMRLHRRMIDLWAASDRKDPLYEMLFFNRAAREFPCVVHGPDVNSPFKSYMKSHPTARFSHK